jgi:hypothetical protein
MASTVVLVDSKAIVFSDWLGKELFSNGISEPDSCEILACRRTRIQKEYRLPVMKQTCQGHTLDMDNTGGR